MSTSASGSAPRGGSCACRAEHQCGNCCHRRSFDLAKFRRFATDTMTSSCISQLFLIIYCSPLITAQCVHQYKVVEATKNGPGLCGLDDPHSKHKGSPLPVCSSRCTVDINCLFFNLKTPLNQAPVCELYHSPQLH